MAAAASSRECQRRASLKVWWTLVEETAEKDEGGVLSSLNSMTRSRDQMGAVTCHSAGGGAVH